MQLGRGDHNSHNVGRNCFRLLQVQRAFADTSRALEERIGEFADTPADTPADTLGGSGDGAGGGVGGGEGGGAGGKGGGRKPILEAIVRQAYW